MKKNCLTFLLLLAMPLSLTAPLAAQERPNRAQEKTQERTIGERRNRQPMPEREVNTDDPDMPGFALQRIDKAEYLRRRAEMIKTLRGLNDIQELNLVNPRGAAVEEMQRQIKERATVVDQEGFRIRNEAAAATAAWTEIGPAPIPNGQTTTVSNPVSGRTVAIAIHPTNPNIVYAGAAQGGLYRSLDGGGSWAQLMDNAQSLAVGAVAISPSNPSTIWVGTGEASFSCDSYFGVGLYRIDNADSASPTLNGPITNDTGGNNVFANRAIGKILIHPTDPNTVFVTTSSGIGGVGCDAPLTAPVRGLYRSTNGQSVSPTFTKLTVGSVGDISHADLAFEPGNPNNMLVTVRGLSAENGGIYRTTDALAAAPTFTRTLALGTTTTRVRAALAINKVGSVVTVYAATGEAGTGICSTVGQSGQLRKSTDGGQTWSSAISSANGFCGGQCSYDITVSVDPTDANKAIIGGSANSTCSTVLKRATNGSSFSASNTGLHADTHVVIHAPSNPSIVYTGDDGGVFKSTDGGANWTSLNKVGFNATQFVSIAVHPSDPYFTIGGTQDNGTQWLKPANTWTRADFGDGGFALIDQNATNTTNVTMYHTYFNVVGSGGLVGLARVTNTANAQDNGWAFLGCGGTSNGLSCNDSAVQFYAPMALGPGNPNTLYFGTDRLYRSTNSGTTMTVVSQQFTSGVATSAIGVSPQNDNIRIVGVENGKVYRTTTGATTLTDVTGSIPAKYIARAVIDPNDVNTAYVTLGGYGLAAGQHVWKTTDLSAATPTWVAAGSGVPDTPVNAFAIDPANSNNIFAGSDIGVYNSTDGGATWTPYGTGFPVVAVFDMAIQNANRFLRIATHGRGMWEISIGAGLPPTIPNAPSALAATAASSSQINLSWTDNSNNESGFKVERCQGSGCANFAEIAQVGAGVATFNDTGLTAGTTYTYRVRAFNVAGDSAYSNTAAATTQAAAAIPAAPSNLATTFIGNRRINLAWNDNSNNENNFELQRKTGSGSYSTIASPAANATTFSNTGLSRQTTYTYRIRACNTSGCSAYSNEVTGTTN